MDSQSTNTAILAAFGTLFTGTTILLMNFCKKERPSKEKANKEKIPKKKVKYIDLSKRYLCVDTFLKGIEGDFPNPMVRFGESSSSEWKFFTLEDCIQNEIFTLNDRQYGSENQLLNAKRYKKSGPKAQIYYAPYTVKAAIVTCGGLCPGENAVIRELVMILWHGYGVREIYGVKYGYRGFYKILDNGKDCFVKLLPDLPSDSQYLPKDIISVKNIHNIGGTILGSSRGGFNVKEIAQGIVKHGLNQVYVIGGDGTHRGLLELSKYFKENKIEVSLIGIPKTIDNDMPVLDKTFGFDTALDIATKSIKCADVEANSAEYGVGFVKVMGRQSGHIALHASLANRDVNICLIPEFPFEVYGDKGLMEYIMKRLLERHHCVIVAAEGAAGGMKDVKLSSEVMRDSSNNILFPDIGNYLKKEVPEYGMKKYKIDISFKYIDPSYTLRSTAPNTSDKYLCAVLAEDAVHAAMAGYTNCSVGIIRNNSALIPFEYILKKSPRLVSFGDRDWQRLIQSTGQPPFLNDESLIEGYYAAEEIEEVIVKQPEEKIIMDDIICECSRRNPKVQELQIIDKWDLDICESQGKDSKVEELKLAMSADSEICESKGKSQTPEESPNTSKSLSQEEVSPPVEEIKEPAITKAALAKGILNIFKRMNTSKQLDDASEYRTVKDNGKVEWKQMHTIFALDCSGNIYIYIK